MTKKTMKKKLVKKSKTNFSLADKIIMLVCCVAITASGVTVVTYAAMTWDAPADISGGLLVTETGTVDGSVESYAPGRPPADCCGTANKTFGYNENSFTSTTSTSTIGVFCKPPATRSTFPRVINFPAQGETVKWNCLCKNADGTPIIGSDGKPIVSSCSATRREWQPCGEANGKLFPDTGSLFAVPNLCPPGTTIGGFSVNETSNCFMGLYVCIYPEDDKTENRPLNCSVAFDCHRFINPPKYCGNGIIETWTYEGKTTIEECEFVQYNYPRNPLYDYFAGKTCKDFGFDMGTLKCTLGCKIDTSGCRKCGGNPSDC